MKDLNGKTAVVTGAASGIGRALTLHLLSEGARVAAADRDEAGLAETVTLAGAAGENLKTYPLDVTDREGWVTFAEKVKNDFGGASILVNNAGVNHDGNFLHTPWEDMEWIFSINYWGVLYGTRAFLSQLMEAGEASLVNVSSLFGLVGVRKQSAYCATKFAVRGFTESMRMELAGTGIAVTSVHPGGIKTNIVRNARMQKRDREATAEEQEKFAVMFDRIAKVSPEEAAAVIVKGIKKNKPRVVIGSDAKIASAIQRLFPSRYEKAFAKIM